MIVVTMKRCKVQVEEVTIKWRVLKTAKTATFYTGFRKCLYFAFLWGFSKLVLKVAVLAVFGHLPLLIIFSTFPSYLLCYFFVVC
jgi:hypothetical protein